jgi:hypothetical protein
MATETKTNWRARAGCLLCKKMEYDPYEGRLITVGSKSRQTVFEVIHVGAGIEGYEIGDLVVVEKGLETVMGTFVREPFVYGKLPKAEREATGSFRSGEQMDEARTATPPAE